MPLSAGPFQSLPHIYMVGLGWGGVDVRPAAQGGAPALGSGFRIDSHSLAPVSGCRSVDPQGGPKPEVDPQCNAPEEASAAEQLHFLFSGFM